MKCITHAAILLVIVFCAAPLFAQGHAKPMRMDGTEHVRGGTPAPAVLLLLGGMAAGYSLLRRRRHHSGPS